MKNGIIPSAGPIAVLDVGTSKTSCFIARVQDDAPPRVVGVGHHASRGVRAGAIVDMEAAESCIRKVVHDAEKMAGETVTGVIANLSAGRPQSRSFAVEVPIIGRPVSEIDLRRAVDQARHVARPDDCELIHSLPVGYSIDGDNGIRDPRGMYGARLGVNMHMITAAGGAVRNLRTCIERAHLDMESVVVGAYASGLACLVEDEMNLGATVIDMGAGTTTVAIFHEGQVIITDGVPVGGGHVTNDIARGLSTPVVHAERMKTLFGSAIASSEDEREVIDVPQVGEDHAEAPNHVPPIHPQWYHPAAAGGDIRASPGADRSLRRGAFRRPARGPDRRRESVAKRTRIGGADSRPARSVGTAAAFARVGRVRIGAGVHDLCWISELRRERTRRLAQPSGVARNHPSRPVWPNGRVAT